MKNKIIIIGIISFIIGLLIYINPSLIYRNYKLTNYIEELTTKKQITSKELVPYNYDKLHIIYPYTSKKDIEKELGIKSRYIKENNNDKYQTIVVIKNNKIISYTNISLKYSFQPLAEYNYISKRDTIIKVSKHDNGYSFIEQNKFIEESFYNIKYQLPGSYWEEDDEEPGKFYYLDIDSNEYLLITKEDKFSYKNYIKNKDISKKEDIKINNYSTKYLESKLTTSSTNSLDITYIITTKESTYIFNLNSTKENLAINKENLYNIIQSVKE